MAAPTYIPVRSNRNQRHGPLGIMHNVSVRSTELAVVYPQRQQRERYIFQPPTYYEDGELHYMVWCSGCAEWQKRRAFFQNTSRPNGLSGHCKTCHNADTAERMRRYRARKRAA